MSKLLQNYIDIDDFRQATEEALGLSYTGGSLGFVLDSNEESKYQTFNASKLAEKKTPANMLGEDYIPSSGVSKFDSKLTRTNIESLKLSIPGLNKPDALQRKKNLEIQI
jgi:hypothetical protein